MIFKTITFSAMMVASLFLAFKAVRCSDGEQFIVLVKTTMYSALCASLTVSAMLLFVALF